MSQWSTGKTDAQSLFIEIVKRWACETRPHTLRRSAFDPGLVRQFLSNLSVLEVEQGQASVFRYVGSAVPRLMGRMTPPNKVSDIPAELASAWQDSAAIDGPVCGLDASADGRSMHAWIRVPMADDQDEITQILCHDVIEAVDVCDQRLSLSNDIHGEDVVLAA